MASTQASGGPDLKIQRYIYIFLRLIHLLAHHPDYATDPEDLKSIAKSVLAYPSSPRPPVCVADSVLLHASGTSSSTSTS